MTSLFLESFLAMRARGHQPSSGVCFRGTYTITVLIFFPRCVRSMTSVKTARRHWQKTT